MSTTNRLCWLDLRDVQDRPAATQDALHHGIDGIVATELADLTELPPSITRILLSERPVTPGDDFGVADVIVAPMSSQTRHALQDAHTDRRFGAYVDVADAATLDEACAAATTEDLTVIRFRDPTKIPLEIVLAAAAGAPGAIIPMAEDLEEAEIIYGVLEHGSDGVLLRARGVGDAAALQRAAAADAEAVKLDEMRVIRTTHAGMGERACVDTCSYLGQDEGILVGSTSKGQLLCVSETHPLPYMPTRPFRVNAGALHSYTLGPGGRTRYLSELTAGDRVTAVRTDGTARLVTVGRVKIESRPLISIDAEANDGRAVNLILQHDWHVRVLGPDAEVLNSTELRPGHRILGHLPTADRHVGYPINEFCREQ